MLGGGGSSAAHRLVVGSLLLPSCASQTALTTLAREGNCSLFLVNSVLREFKWLAEEPEGSRSWSGWKWWLPE